MPPAAETADIETSSEGYARRFASRAGQWMLGLQENVVGDWLARPASKSVLDVGGGHGQLAIPLAARGLAVTVLGSDESCRQRISAEVASGRVAFSTGDLLASPFPDQSFDTVTCIRLLPHCTRWSELVGELCRVAATRVVVDYPAFWSVNVAADLFFGLKRRLEGNTRPFRLFRHREVREAFARHGFRPARRKPQFFLPMVLHRLLNRPAFSQALESGFAVTGLTRLLGSPVLAEFVRIGPPAPPPPPAKVYAP